MAVDHVMDDDERERVMAAVHNELARWGIDRFDVGAMADHHDLDIDAIQQSWPDAETLVLEALTQRPGDDVPLPDTGSLRTDLFVLAQRMAALVTSEPGRRLHGGHLIGDTQVASVHLRQAAWRSRAARLTEVFERARDRGEIDDSVDPHTALELLFAPVNMRALYTGEVVDDAYCRTVADLVYRAVAG